MVNRDHRSDYDGPATERCERALVTLIGDIGPWSDRVALVGGLAPRYIVDSIPAHVGAADVDLLGERFETIDKDGPRSYAAFVAESASNDASVAARRTAQATVAAFLASLT